VNDVALCLVMPCVTSFLICASDRRALARDAGAQRSECDSCRRQLGPAELVPIFSWLTLRGRCKGCFERISPHYLLAELSALLIAVWSIYQLEGNLAWLTAVLGCVLLTLAFQDYRYQILGDIFTLPLILAGLATAPFWSPAPFWQHVAGAAIGFLSLWAINAMYRQLRGRNGLGLGDAKLFAATGAWLTISGLASTLLYASLFACIAVILAAMIGFKLSKTTRIPFGIFLCLGFWLTWLYGPLELGTLG